MILLRGIRVLATLLLLVVSTRTSAQQSAASGEIRGRLTATGTSQPIVNGSVASRRDGDTAFTAGSRPDSTGSFRIDGLRAGRYTVRVRALGYTPMVRAGLVVSAEHPIVDLGTLNLGVVATEL